MSQSDPDSHQFVRAYFVSPAAVSGDDASEMLRKSAQRRGMEAPDGWIPDDSEARSDQRGELTDLYDDGLVERGMNVE